MLQKDSIHTLWVCAARQSHIELSMTEHGSMQIKTNPLDTLTLHLIDGHSKCEMNRELSTPERNGIIFRSDIEGREGLGLCSDCLDELH